MGDERTKTLTDEEILTLQTREERIRAGEREAQDDDLEDVDVDADDADADPVDPS